MGRRNEINRLAHKKKADDKKKKQQTKKEAALAKKKAILAQVNPKNPTDE